MKGGVMAEELGTTTSVHVEELYEEKVAAKPEG